MQIIYIRFLSSWGAEGKDLIRRLLLLPLCQALLCFTHIFTHLLLGLKITQ